MKILSKTVICMALLTAVTAQPLGAKKHLIRQMKVYMMGVAVSLNDSLAYITDLQPVDSVSIVRKTKFLADRPLYSAQFKRHLEQRYKGGPYVCAVFYGKNLKKQERRYLTLHKRYANSKIFRLTTEDQSHFRFKAEAFFNESSLVFKDESKAGRKAKKGEKKVKGGKPDKPGKGDRPGRPTMGSGPGGMPDGFGMPGGGRR